MSVIQIAALIALILLAMGSLLAALTPYRIWLLTLALIAVAAQGGATGYAWSTHRWAETFLSPRVYSLDATSPGEHTVRIPCSPEYDGLLIRFAHVDGTPRYGEDLKSCEWKLRGSEGTLALSGEMSIGRLLHVPDESLRWVDVSYQVNSENQALLSSVRLLASATNGVLMSADMTSGANLMLARAFAAATLLALAGVASQLVRRARSRRHLAGPLLAVRQ